MGCRLPSLYVIWPLALRFWRRSYRFSTEIGLEENATFGEKCTQNIQNMFRQFLDREEMNGLVDGVPTKAALGGARHGRGEFTRRGQPPSFIDIGIYHASFRCWADTKLPQVNEAAGNAPSVEASGVAANPVHCVSWLT
jgi:hypothetical protein